MKLFAILLIVMGLVAIALNILMIPTINVPDTDNQQYLAGYYIGSFILAIGGVVLVCIGGVVYRRAVRRQRIREGKIFTMDFERGRTGEPR